MLKIDETTPAILIGARIRECRERMGMTIDDLAKEINYSYDHLSKIERGERTLPSDVLGDVAKKLKTTPDYLITGKMYCTQETLHVIALIILLLQDIEKGSR